MASHLRMSFTIIENASQVVIDGHGPLCGLPNFLDALILEHLDKVLLDPVLKYLRVLLRWHVLDRGLTCRLNLVAGEELPPVLCFCEIKVHEDGVVRLLDVHPHVLAADDGVYLGQWTDRVIKADVKVVSLANGDAPEPVLLLLEGEVVALGSQGVPKLEAAGRIIALAHDEDHLAVGHASA